MKVTREWLMRFRGKNWTRIQINALGLTYPLPKDWLGLISGTEISEDQAKEFEEGCGRSIQVIDKPKYDAMEEEVYYTVPDGKGSFKGRWLEPHEVGTFPDE